MTGIDGPPTFIEVNLDAIAHNVRAIKAHIGARVRFLAVVKANAYGHGAVEVARAALESGADGLAVARVSEGVALREAGIDAPVLVMSHTTPGEAASVAGQDLTLTVTDLDTARAFAAGCAALGQPAAVHVKVDTGMGRYGLLPGEVTPFFTALAAIPNLTITGIFSHFAVADQADQTFTRQQLATFQDVLAWLEAAGHPRPPMCHIANSAAMLDLPAAHLDAVRVGIALYGLYPSGEVPPRVPLQPALSLRSRVARVRILPPGASVSYGRTFIAPRETVVALVPVGYGDGYHRILSNRGAALVNGQRVPVIGRVCMDQFSVDVTDAGPVTLGDEVVLIGEQGAASIRAEEVARWAETINYEVTTSLLPRLPRVYRRGGKLLPPGMG